MFILQIGAHQKHQNILKLHLFYVIISSYDERTFPALRKGILKWSKNITGKECSKRICLRTDGQHAARFTDKNRTYLVFITRLRK